jgi:hypothetical protein
MGTPNDSFIKSKYTNDLVNEQTTDTKHPKIMKRPRKRRQTITNPKKKSKLREQYYVSDSDIYRRIAFHNCIKMRLNDLLKNTNHK